VKQSDFVPGSFKSLPHNGEPNSTSLSSNSPTQVEVYLTPKQGDVNFIHLNELCLQFRYKFTLLYTGGAFPNTKRPIIGYIGPKGVSSVINKIDYVTNGASFNIQLYNQLESMIIRNSVPKPYADSSPEYYSYAKLVEGLLTPMAPFVITVGTETSSGSSIYTKDYVVEKELKMALHNISPFISNMPLFYMNDGTVKLRLYFNNVQDAIYFIIPDNYELNDNTKEWGAC
jgi:hypothetical protein